ncbi:ER membrane protein complex subunit 10-like [Styela clava]|uniref:ER membrane protein complex subunit 10-like n=1 Tax=Styela clava TaxID=7725 RepID=UPI00193AAD7C|nr:ER membrane protein complex subunit 10-like [Styela clava]
MHLLLMVVCISSIQGILASTDGYSLVLQHDLGNGFYVQRGVILFPTMKGEDADIIGQKELNTTELHLINKLQSGNGIYKLRVRSQLITTDVDKQTIEDGSFVTAYTDAKSLLASGLQDEITILTDGLGNIISIEVKLQQNAGESDLENFSTILKVNSIQSGPVPDTAGFLNKLKEEKLKKEKADKDPKSFIGKYWMYILPVVFIMMMSSANQQQQQ